MTDSPTWLLPARSIPVWGTAATRELPGEMEAAMNEAVTDYIADHGHEPGDGAIIKYRRVVRVVDLSNPDTFAAARDRLAVAMGAPPEKVREGVIFAWSDKKLWTLRAGLDPRQPGVWVEGITTFEADEDPVSRELALALAWQRVVGS